MYSLYRAWLSLTPCGGLPTTLPPLPPSALSTPLNLSTPSQLPGVPDVSLQVGPTMTQFSAHKAVLATHSGFFKAALANHAGTTPILVPNINVDEFSSLLTFMYTGYLDLNITNIYNILLATHILHMPRALEICRSFLLHAQTIDAANHRPAATTNAAPTTTTNHIIKPIASRKAAPPTQQIYAPAYTDLQKHEDTPFRSVNAAADRQEALAVHHHHQHHHQASTSKSEEPTFQPQNVAASSSSSSVEKGRSAIPEKKGGNPERQQRHKRRADGGGGNGEKVVIDIACCDGPVRFHRVVNKNYGLQPTNADSQQQFEVQDQINRNAAMNKVMTENIRGKQMPDENSAGGQPGAPGGGVGGGGETFTCLYCNHTFKSQYCYQKHARRHLNPVTVEANKGATAAPVVSGAAAAATGTAPREAAKREVKLLDMNVQYYPCKSCGSKFPSYYFVHKHRKMCHADEMGDGGGGGKPADVGAGQQPEGGGVGANSSDTQGTNGSNIDVEAINTDN